MTLVDTTVWIDLFRGRNTTQVRRLEDLLAEDEDICVCGVILAEVLQGIRDDKGHARTSAAFDSFLYLPMSKGTFLSAAGIYRRLRRGGVTIRNAVDCMIAAVAIENDVALLHNDRDFAPIARHCGLKVVETATSIE